MRVLAFGDLQSRTWGVTWLPRDDVTAKLAIRADAAEAQLEVALHADGAEDTWSLQGEGISLEFAATSEGGLGQDPGGRLSTHDQLCQVSGLARLDGSMVEVRCLGWRSGTGSGADADEFDSFRMAAGWLEPVFGFSALALRPGRARGQEADVLAAVVIEDPAAPPVVDPRLSTTYTEAGLPWRTGLELWLQEEDEEADASEGRESPQYPRRAAGQVVGTGLDWREGTFALHAALLHWHSHGREGPGVYVLGQRR